MDGCFLAAPFHFRRAHWTSLFRPIICPLNCPEATSRAQVVHEIITSVIPSRARDRSRERRVFGYGTEKRPTKRSERSERNERSKRALIVTSKIRQELSVRRFPVSSSRSRDNISLAGESSRWTASTWASCQARQRPLNN